MIASAASFDAQGACHGRMEAAGLPGVKPFVQMTRHDPKSQSPLVSLLSKVERGVIASKQRVRLPSTLPPSNVQPSGVPVNRASVPNVVGPFSLQTA